MSAERSKFFNPDDYPFVVQGFHEYFVDADTFEALGQRSIEEPSRPLGSDGRLLMVVTENLVLTRGLKQRIVKASPKKPRRLWSMLEPVCGMTKTSHVPLSERGDNFTAVSQHKQQTTKQ